MAKSLKSIASMIKYEDDLMDFLGNIIPNCDTKANGDELYYNRLDFKIMYNYKFTTGSKDLLVHSFIIKTLKDLYEMILNDPRKEENPIYYNNLLIEYKKFIIEYMMYNPEFERIMIKNNLDITKAFYELPQIDSEFAKFIISKYTVDVSKYEFAVKTVLELINAFNQKLFENVYPYLSDEIKTSFEKGMSYGR